MKTTMDHNEGYLRKQFYMLLSKAGIEHKNKIQFLAKYNVTSEYSLDAHQLLSLCNDVEKIAFSAAAEMDKYRKGLIAAIGAWLRAMNQEENIGKIKSIACRAAGKESFNSISKERLRSLYYAFVKKRKDLQFVTELTSEELSYLTFNN
ncbi:MAG: hypothetical protein JW857_11895 [Bacteroidales bacterium]|nr:hypothetical protein [Bacteroidales bacterium]MBN2747180.1 hypothetical protein [Bacteroidales bacterium]